MGSCIFRNARWDDAENAEQEQTVNSHSPQDDRHKGTAEVQNPCAYPVAFSWSSNCPLSCSLQVVIAASSLPSHHHTSLPSPQPQYTMDSQPVKMPDGRVVAFAVNRDDTCSTLKSQVQKVLGTPYFVLVKETGQIINDGDFLSKLVGSFVVVRLMDVPQDPTGAAASSAAAPAPPPRRSSAAASAAGAASAASHQHQGSAFPSTGSSAAAAAAGPSSPAPPAEEPEECSVCLEIFTPSFPAEKIGCNHCFHRSCITEWMEHSLFCPLCRRPIQITAAAAATPSSHTAAGAGAAVAMGTVVAGTAGAGGAGAAGKESGSWEPPS